MMPLAVLAFVFLVLVLVIVGARAALGTIFGPRRFRGTRPSDWMAIHLIDTTESTGRWKWPR
jgi:hypothetical protein